MIEVFPSLWVGNGDDIVALINDRDIPEGWFVVTAARDPWHREALGYTTRGAPKDSPEYLFAVRHQRIILNMFDGDDPSYINEDMVQAAMKFITEARENGGKILIHCNQGQSRAPTLALLWLRFEGPPLLRAALSMLSYDDACDAFREVYAPFAPGKGMDQYARSRWEAE